MVVKPGPLRQILQEGKDLEIRHWPCRKWIGKRMWLSESSSFCVTAKAVVVAIYGPLSEREWNAARGRHMVKGARLYGARTHAWELRQVERVHPPIPIGRKKGSLYQLGPKGAAKTTRK